MLPALQSDATIGHAPEDLLYHLQFIYDETFAVLNGRTPLVDFTPQYSSLWPFANALAMTIFGKTLLTFSLTMTAVGTLALLAVYGVLRRVTGNAVTAALLYLPFLASSLFLIGDTLENRSTVGTYFGTFPLRYAGPWFVAWLTARQLARREPPRATSLWALFSVAGLALLNNGDFGVAATGASVAALPVGDARQPQASVPAAPGGARSRRRRHRARARLVADARARRLAAAAGAARRLRAPVRARRASRSRRSPASSGPTCSSTSRTSPPSRSQPCGRHGTRRTAR